MDGQRRFAVIGTDARLAAAGRALARAGFAVGGPEQTALADYILLPLPLDESRTPLAELLRAAKPGALALGGKLSAQARQIAAEAGVELVDYFAIGQCTPGVIAVNTATFIGQKHRGWLGGIVATLGVVFPSLVIISILAGLITNFSHLAWVQNAFAGIQVCVCVLIFNAVLKLLKKSVVDKRTAAIFLIVMAGSLFLHISPVWFVVVSAVAGILLKNLEGRAAK